ncbi:hypothetical protein, partial [Proteus mirabilis]|uniref:hypothetical protein n=1 Tax=Proteus mirabilis TaxID=584 RepID=UPI0019545CAD
SGWSSIALAGIHGNEERAQERGKHQPRTQQDYARGTPRGQGARTQRNPRGEQRNPHRSVLTRVSD